MVNPFFHSPIERRYRVLRRPRLKEGSWARHPLARSYRVNLHRRHRQPLTVILANDIVVFHSHTPEPRIKNLRLNGQHHTRLERRVELRRDHWNLIQLETYTVRDEADLVFSSTHEVGGK